MRKQRNMDQVKEQNYAQKKNKPNGDSQLSDAEFKTLEIRMLIQLSTAKA